MVEILSHLTFLVIGLYLGIVIQQYHIKKYVLSAKNHPKPLEKVMFYSDIGIGGQCPTCGCQNKIENDRCIECKQKLIPGR